MRIPLGQFKPALFFQVCSYGIAVSLIIIYWISQYYGHEKPFPDPSISSVAGHYPEFVIFRISTISGAVFIVLGWLTNHFYVLSVAKEAVWRINKILPKTVLTMGVMGGLALMGSSANIDTGKRNQWLHLKCAETFFLATVLSLLLNTLLSWYVQLNTRALNKANMTAKTIVSVALIIQTYLSATQTQEDNANLVTFTIIAGFLCMTYDVRDYKFVYEVPSARPCDPLAS